MKNKMKKFSEKEKRDLSDKLYQIAERNELIFKKMLEEVGVDTSKIKIIDRAKFTTKYIPDVLEELLEKYGPSKILMDDEDVKNEALDLIQRRFHEDLAKQIVKSWNIYYILRHCKILEPLKIDESVTLIPFNGWSCNDFLEVIDRLFYKSGLPASRLSEEIYEEMKEYFRKLYSEKNPTGLLIFQEIEAETEKEVYDKTKNYAENVLLCVSNLTNSSIEIGGWVVEGVLNGIKRIHPTIYFPYYKPTYMIPKGIEEVTKRILQNVDENHLLKLALKYENEALYENEEKFRILKRWSALVFIADEYSQRRTTNGKLLTKHDIQKITTYIQTILNDKNHFEMTSTIEDKIRTNVSQINYKKAKDKVRDLMNWVGHPIKTLDDAEKDIIDVIYQHRNCIVHRGGCYKSDENIREECEGPAYCRKCKLGLKELNGELSRILTRIIGKFVNVEFEFHSEIPEHIKRILTNGK